MALFSNLGERLNHIFSKLTKHGKLTSLEIKEAMREIRVALLEADVNFKVAKDFCAQVSEKALGEEILKSYNPDIFVTASYGQIIKQNILDIPSYGTVNVHASLLPKYRGPAPIQGAILNGEKKTGITIMKTDIGCDTGDIYFSREIPIENEDTSTSVFNKLATLGVECINEFFDNFEKYKDNHTPQDNSKATYFPMIKKEDYLLDFNICSFDLCNKIRALENCYFIYKGMRFKVPFAVVNEKSGTPGEILACNGKAGLIIATKDRAIEVVTIQPEGKQKMFAIALMNSNKFTLGDIIENK